MRIDQQPAYVLHARAYRESSLLLECFTRDHGRVGLVARGVRKEKSRMPRALLQAFVPLLLSWSGGGELATLIAADAEGAPVALAGEASLCGLYVNELVLRMTMRQDAHADLFAAYGETLLRLAGAESAAWTLRRFERDLLEFLGYGANLAIDALSGEPIESAGEYGYRHEVGTVRWTGPADGARAKGSALLALAADVRPHDDELGGLRRWMRGVIAGHVIGGELQAWKLLDASPLRRRE